MLISHSHWFSPQFLLSVIEQRRVFTPAIVSTLQWRTDHYRPQTKFAKVMFSQVSLCPQGEGSRSLFRVGSPYRGVSAQGGSLLRRSLSREVSVGGSLSGRPPYGNMRAVRSLLECILVTIASMQPWMHSNHSKMSSVSVLFFFILRL